MKDKPLRMIHALLEKQLDQIHQEKCEHDKFQRLAIIIAIIIAIIQKQPSPVHSVLFTHLIQLALPGNLHFQ